MLRLNLTSEDLRRVRVADAPAAVLELTNHARSEQLLHSREHREELQRRGVDPADLALFGHLFGGACSPGFLHPHVADPRAAIEIIVGTPAVVVRRDLREMAEHGYPRRAWTLDLARSGPDAARLRGQLADTLLRLLGAIVEPKLDRTLPLLRRRRERLLDTQQRLGSAALLNSLDGSIRFRPPYLEVDLASGADVSAALHGAGVLLVPSLSAVPAVTVSSTGGPATVTFFLGAPSGGPTGPQRPPPRSLERLIGRSRAGVLARLAAHPSVGTRELARYDRSSPASASEHLAILRAAGLVETVEVIGGACHHVTPLGHELLAHHVGDRSATAEHRVAASRDRAPRSTGS